MKIIFYLIFFIISFMLGISFIFIITPIIGTLKINTSSTIKDILLFDFKTPPEDLIENTKKHMVFMLIEDNSQIDHISK